MAVTWEVLDIRKNQQNHTLTVVFRENVDGVIYDYPITKPPDATKAEFMAELKQKVLAARQWRARVAVLIGNINVTQIETFINS